MNKIYTFIFVFVLAPLLCLGQGSETSKSVAPDSKGVDGWRSAHWGMSEDEVIASFPKEAKRFAESQKYHGMTSTIGIEKLEISGEEFNVRFLFDDQTKRLKQINLNPTSIKALEVVFPTLERDLTEKYGKPDFSDDREPIAEAKEMRRSWLKGKTRIELYYFRDSGINQEILVLTYQSVPENGDKNL